MSSQKEVHSERHAEQLKSRGAGNQRVCGLETGNQGKWERPSRSLWSSVRVHLRRSGKAIILQEMQAHPELFMGYWPFRPSGN